MRRNFHLLINGLSVGSGGGYTVARELWRHLAIERPEWLLTLSLVAGHPLHEKMRVEAVAPNCAIQWAPPSASSRRLRARYEAKQLPASCRDNHVDAVVQLNGMLIPALRLPTLAHFQDPWPYRPEAWNGLKDRAFAFLKRRQHLRALRNADATSWTSSYLRDLICGRLGVSPRRSGVLYNGVPESWIERAAENLPPWEGRQLRIVSVSNVNPYKRQELVIRALPLLLKRSELAALTYHIVGECSDDYRAHLTAIARKLGVEQRLVIEGRVSDERVSELLLSSRCFVLMSICESFGIPAVEAMTFGTPVVTSDCCAMPEVCGNAAVLSPIDDIEALVQNIESVLTDTARAQSLRRAGSQRVARFSWRRTAAGMAQIVEEIAMEKRTRPASDVSLAG